jgi:hypothetical protein
MELRRELRIACYQRALLMLLSEDRRAIGCHVMELSGRALRIVIEEPIPVNTPISIETRDWLAFGEVCYSRREYSHYVVGLDLDQVVVGLRELDALRQNRLHERKPATRPEPLSLAL